MERHPDESQVSDKHLSLKIMIPVIIGLGVIVWLFHDEFNKADLSAISFTPFAIFSIFLGWMGMVGRDFGLTWRFREITARQLSWRQALKVNMLCEFTSAVTPSSAGGSTLGLIYLHREGIGWGKSATLMMTILFLDNLFFTIATPLLFLVIPYDTLFGFGTDTHTFTMGLTTVFWIVYGALATWTAVLFTGIFLRPRAIRALFITIFRLPLLRRWSESIREFGDNIVTTSGQLRQRSVGWWVKVFAATSLSWCSRFMVINMLFLGFAPEAPQLVVFGRQFIVWVVLMICPTPGGSGISEWIFKNYYGDLIGGSALVMVIAIFWRLISYYVYLVIGAFLVPRWIAQGHRMKRLKEEKAVK